jgi:hypothetical protein
MRSKRARGARELRVWCSRLRGLERRAREVCSFGRRAVFDVVIKVQPASAGCTVFQLDNPPLTERRSGARLRPCEALQDDYFERMNTRS